MTALFIVFMAACLGAAGIALRAPRRPRLLAVLDSVIAVLAACGAALAGPPPWMAGAFGALALAYAWLALKWARIARVRGRRGR